MSDLILNLYPYIDFEYKNFSDRLKEELKYQTNYQELIYTLAFFHWKGNFRTSVIGHNIHINK